jgi:hypothetical protein
MVLIVAILVGWFLLSVPVALVLGRMLRKGTVVGASTAPAPTARPTAAVPSPREHGSGAGPRAA